MRTSAVKFLKIKKVRHFTGFQEFIAEMICKLNSKLSLTPVSKWLLLKKWIKKVLSIVIPKLLKVRFQGLGFLLMKITPWRMKIVNLQTTFYLTWRLFSRKKARLSSETSKCIPSHAQTLYSQTMVWSGNLKRPRV